MYTAIPTGAHGRCGSCGAIVAFAKGPKIEVWGDDAQEVADVMSQASREHRAAENATRPPSPWVSGSFYLVAVLMIVVILLVGAALVPIWVLPFAIIGGFLLVLVVGALQLRQDDRLSEKNFVELMAMSMKRLPLVAGKKDGPPSDPNP